MTIQDNLQTIGTLIFDYAQANQRDANEIQLLAVSKRHSTACIREAFNAGQISFGENYVQELLEKAEALSDLSIDWHFIGPLQSNKTKKVAEVVNWVHTVDRFKIAQRLNDQRPKHLAPLNICLQINISKEVSKSGVLPDDVEALARDVAELPQLKLRGLMAIPAPQVEIKQQRLAFAELASLKNNLNQKGFNLDTLSMGMSNDMEAAIAEGATIVRIGTAIFGTRL